MLGRRWVVAIVAVAAVLGVAVGVIRIALHRSPGPAATAPPAYDPPSGFATDGADLPRDADADPLPAVLSGFDAVVALPAGLQVVDTRSGDVRAEVTGAALTGAAQAGAADDVTLTGDTPAAPVRGSVGGRAAAVAAFGARVAGHGTTPAHDAVLVVAVDPASGAVLARARVDLPVVLDGGGVGGGGLRSAAVVGASGDRVVVVVRTGTGDAPASYGVDVDAARATWSAPGFEAQAVVAGVVAGARSEGTGGLGERRLAALGAADGRDVWQADGDPQRSVRAFVAGAGLLAVVASNPVTGETALGRRDAVTGALLATEAVPGGTACVWDERSVTVCSQPDAGQAWAAGFDAATGRRLWALPDAAAGRVAPRVSTAWHGTVYGTTDNGPVALDARTGADRPTSPQVAPDLVNAYVGLVAATTTRPRPSAHLAVS